MPICMSRPSSLFGPENGAVSERLVYAAAKEANARNYVHLVVIGFGIEPNARRLVDACAELVGHLLRMCPYLHVLATSREPLAIHGEMTWLVRPLELPDPRLHASADQIARSAAVRTSLAFDSACSIKCGRSSGRSPRHSKAATLISFEPDWRACSTSGRTAGRRLSHRTDEAK